jgi:hypothetical protein
MPGLWRDLVLTLPFTSARLVYTPYAPQVSYIPGVIIPVDNPVARAQRHTFAS